MPLIRTDDGPRKLRDVWLGPRGATIPVAWTYPMWAAQLLQALVLCPGLGAVVSVVIGNWWVGMIAVPLILIYPMGRLTYKVMSTIDYDKPAGYQWRTFRGHWKNGPVAPSPDAQQVTMPAVPGCRGLSRAVLLALRWTDGGQLPEGEPAIPAAPMYVPRRRPVWPEPPIMIRVVNTATAGGHAGDTGGITGRRGKRSREMPAPVRPARAAGEPASPTTPVRSAGWSQRKPGRALVDEPDSSARPVGQDRRGQVFRDGSWYEISTGKKVRK